MSKVVQRTITPFSGNYYDSDGKLRNIDGHLVTGDGFKNPNTQINGDYYDHEGNIKNLKELLDSFTSGSGGSTDPGLNIQVKMDINYSSDAGILLVSVHPAEPMTDSTVSIILSGTTRQGSSQQHNFAFSNNISDYDFFWQLTNFSTKIMSSNDAFLNLWTLFIIRNSDNCVLYSNIINFVKELPSGGTTGQVLAKVSNTNRDFTWVSPTAGTGGLPNGGSSGQILTKASSVDGDAEWVDVPDEELPSGGNAGQLLGKASATDKDVTWVDPPTSSGLGI
ncbi:MAG: hypothetical protein LBD57_04565, partial [Endomicrobium sp.]|nr:hypothetical protein [Endomicrobium sp.]